MLRLLDRIEDVLIATLIAVATLLIFLSVTHRFAIGLAADLVACARSGGMGPSVPLPNRSSRP